MSDVGSSVKQPPGIDDARKSTLYLFAGFLVSWLPMPLSGIAVLPLVASFVYAVRHVMALRRAGAPAAVVNSSIGGVALTTLLIGLVLAPSVQYVRTFDYQKCMWGANTHQAVTACKSKNHENPGGLAKFFLD